MEHVGFLVLVQHVENLADLVSTLDRVPQWAVALDAVGVAAAFSKPVEVSGRDEVAHDALGSAFGDSDPVGDIAEPDPRVACDAQQSMRVIRQEGPLRHDRSVLPAWDFRLFSDTGTQHQS
jgi:hypothetical protein